MSDHYIDRDLYDRSGEPIDFARWILLFEDDRYQQLAFDEIGGYRVSTIWLGIDHGCGMSDEPLIFETMVFKDRKSVAQDRYCSEEEALAGHARLLAEVSLFANAG